MIRILCLESEQALLNLPQPSDIYNDEESDLSDEEEGDSDEENRRFTSTTERIERRLIKRKRRDAWRKNRDQILWKYHHKAYISTPVSFTI